MLDKGEKEDALKYLIWRENRRKQQQSDETNTIRLWAGADNGGGKEKDAWSSY